MQISPSALPSRDVARYVLITIAITAVAALLWLVADMLVLAFGGIVFAVVLRAIAGPVGRVTGWSDRWAVTFTVLLLAALFGALAWLFGDHLVGQVQNFREQLPAAIEKVRGWIEKFQGGKLFLGSLQSGASESKWMGDVAKIAGMTVGMLANALLIIFVGIYLALDPGLYLKGILKLVPTEQRPKVRDALLATGIGLHKWLVGQFVVMIFVGVTTGLGLWAIGVPSALMLGVLAGLLEFVPLIGPILSAIPGLLLASLEGPSTMFYALLVYVAMQQLEGIIATPIAQRWSVKLPPALTLISLFGVGLVFGTLGVIFATPMTVALMILVEKLYIKRVADRPAEA